MLHLEGWIHEAREADKRLATAEYKLLFEDPIATAPGIPVDL
jgi:hypothetical protein